MIVKAVVLVDKNGAIGSGGQQPFHLVEDLKSFLHLTKGHVVVAGRKTLDVIGRPLANRTVLGLSSDTSLKDNPGKGHADAYFNTDTALRKHLQTLPSDTHVWVIGGGEVYRLFKDLYTDIYATVLIDTLVPEADTWFLQEEGQSKDFHEHLLQSGYTVARSIEVLDKDKILKDRTFHTEHRVYSLAS